MENRYIINSHDLLRIELAVVIDAGRIFVEKTYVLEGDVLPAFDAYQHLQEVFCRQLLPQCAVAKDITPDDLDHQQELKHYAKGCVQPAIKYFLKRFSHVDGNFYHIVRAFKAAQLCCPGM